MKKIIRITTCIKNNRLLAIAFFLIVIGVITIVSYLIMLSKNYSLGNSDINIGETAEVGEFVGGFVGTIFSLAGFFLIFLTFKTQNKSFKTERIENRLFELIKWHRENVNEMSYEDPLIQNRKLKGPAVFKFILDQIEDCYEEIAPFFNVNLDEIFNKSSLEKLNILNAKRTQIDLENMAKCEIAYVVVFFGLSDNDFNTASKQLQKTYKDCFFLPILNYLRLKPNKNSIRNKNWFAIKKSEPNTILSKMLEITKAKDFTITVTELDNYIGDLKTLMIKKFFLYYGGHQFKLGHYFRHLFQIVNYIDSQELTYESKYNYVKTLRGQLSTYEQVIFFFNSLSFMGRIWELDQLKLDDVNLQLITKYNLIKNLSELHLFKDINVKNYYPDISFEFEKEPIGREILIHQYI